jgi:hypothetical protein
LEITIAQEFFEDDFLSEDTVVREIPLHFCLPFSKETRIIGVERHLDRMNTSLFVVHPNLPMVFEGHPCPRVNITRLREFYPYLILEPKQSLHEMNIKEQNFCAELTTLLVKHGYGIADAPRVYELQSGPDSDYGRNVSIDGEGHLNFV